MVDGDTVVPGLRGLVLVLRAPALQQLLWESMALRAAGPRQHRGTGRRLDGGRDRQLQQDNPGLTQCQDFKKKTDPDVHCADYEAWAANGDSEDPRVVSLFVVPYQSLKNVTGGGTNDEIPVLRFASFYVMNWHGNTPAPTIRVPTSTSRASRLICRRSRRQGHDPRCLRYHRQLRDRPGRLECHLQ